MRPRLDEGEVSRSQEAAALLVLLKQLLQSLHVQRVIVVHLLLGGLWALGHRDGVAHCRDRGTQVGEGPRLHAQQIAAFFPGQGHSPTVVMGLARGTRPQDLAEKRPQPQKMQGEKLRSLLMVTWNRRCQESGAKTLTLKMSFSPKEYTGTREALGREGQERKWLGTSGAREALPNSSPTGYHLPRH